MAEKEKMIAYIDKLMAKMPYDLLRKLFITASVFAEHAEKEAGKEGECP